MKVLIADPKPQVRHALSIWVSNQPGWEIVAEAENSAELLGQVGQLAPGVVILDRDLPGMPAEDLVGRLRQASHGVAIIILAAGEIERCQASRLGADYYVSKADPPERMLDAVLKARHQLESKFPA